MKAHPDQTSGGSNAVTARYAGRGAGSLDLPNGVRRMRRRGFITLIGGAISWPLAAGAQQRDIPVVGFMSGRAPDDSAPLVAAFRQGLADAGFVDHQSVLIEFRWAHGDYALLPGFAGDLANRKVAVLVGVGGDVSAVAATKATKTIPVVFGMGGDPVKAGMVASFNRPGGNATGYTLWTSEMESKRLGLLRELLPGPLLIGVLVNPQFPPTGQEFEDLEPAAKTVNQKLFVAGANTDADLDAALDSFVQQRVGAFLVTASPFFDTRHDRIIDFAAQNRLPAVYQFRQYATAGGLMSYGPNIVESYRNAGVYVGRILKGEKPGDLPIMQPSKFDFVINLKTAKALGITVPPTLLAEAGEVIE
jgi:putative tryptophan/tyrosine transport system substrate-binding protein